MMLKSKGMRLCLLVITLLLVLSSFNNAVFASEESSNKMFDFDISEDGTVTIKGDALKEDTAKESANIAMGRIKLLAGIVGGLVLMGFVIILILLFVKVSTIGNSAKRGEVLKQILIVIATIIATGSVSAIVAISYFFF